MPIHKFLFRNCGGSALHLSDDMQLFGISGSYFCGKVKVVCMVCWGLLLAFWKSLIAFGQDILQTCGQLFDSVKSGKLNMKSRTIGLSWFVPSRRAQAAFTYFDFKVYQNLTGEIGKSECCVLFLLL